MFKVFSFRSSKNSSKSNKLSNASVDAQFPGKIVRRLSSSSVATDASTGSSSSLTSIGSTFIPRLSLTYESAIKQCFDTCNSSSSRLKGFIQLQKVLSNNKADSFKIFHDNCEELMELFLANVNAAEAPINSCIYFILAALAQEGLIPDMHIPSVIKAIINQGLVICSKPVDHIKSNAVKSLYNIYTNDKYKYTSFFTEACVAQLLAICKQDEELESKVFASKCLVHICNTESISSSHQTAITKYAVLLLTNRSSLIADIHDSKDMTLSDDLASEAMKLIASLAAIDKIPRDYITAVVEIIFLEVDAKRVEDRATITHIACMLAKHGCVSRSRHIALFALMENECYDSSPTVRESAIMTITHLIKDNAVLAPYIPRIKKVINERLSDSNNRVRVAAINLYVYIMEYEISTHVNSVTNVTKTGRKTQSGLNIEEEFDLMVPLLNDNAIAVRINACIVLALLYECVFDKASALYDSSKEMISMHMYARQICNKCVNILLDYRDDDVYKYVSMEGLCRFLNIHHLFNSPTNELSVDAKVLDDINAKMTAKINPVSANPETPSGSPLLQRSGSIKSIMKPRSSLEKQPSLKKVQFHEPITERDLSRKQNGPLLNEISYRDICASISAIQIAKQDYFHRDVNLETQERVLVWIEKGYTYVVSSSYDSSKTEWILITSSCVML